METNNVKPSAKGTESQTPLNSQNWGSMIKNRIKSTKDRKKVIMPERCPFPYAMKRTALKILKPEKRNPKPYHLIPLIAMA